ncbi:conserved hypothetical protein [Leishmania infantum JPCM5]|uniref:Uncharacterized protein n=2 Tax=Leishmania infantum TaxID=5671 RepID=A4I2E7_LEIIN|nr:conserved hypothetical protein [Leishmania infantum JPCM5]CAC9497531.1 hypothetical_protein_-_conserved [Leishmania infantum]CAM68937.1 conserved hypothetical protein [Leishmania infantum JPCM5]SUZ42814.1 hypothetical_protein_-_conserved [Leishmania infantum]|eukprot:XP_001470558.1 conserved hypothetical protein [Leishmania infantum JPCM5]
MAQQHPHRRYEGYAYPTEFQSAPTGSRDSGGGAYFGRERIPSPSATSLSGATGLVRRSVQHTGAAAVAAASTGANAASYQGSYGYFHGQGNSIDITSGYNSDAGSSTSNPLYGGGGRSGYIVPNTSSQHQEVVVGTSRSSAGASGANSTEPSPGVWAAEPGVNGLTASGRRLSKLPPRLHEPGIFQPSSDGSAGSITNSTIGSNSARPPTQQTFLPSEPLMQPLPLAASQHRRHHYQQQPYVVSMPSSAASNLQRGTASGAAPPEAAFVQRSSSCAASPINMSGPRMPAAYDASASPNIAGGAVFGSGRTSGFLGRLIAQVLPVVDDSAGDPGSGIGAGSAAPIGERPLHQLRFGNPADDLPLLEELGIFPRHILGKARAVLNPFKSISVDAAKDTDLAGPVLFALSLAVLLSLRGKIQFSAIYGLFMLGVGFFKMLLSLMQPRGGVPLQFVASTIGYGLLPTVLLAAVRTVGSWIMGLRGVLPLTLLMVAWSSWCGTTLVAKGLGMEEQRYLVLYPMLLFYSTFNVVAVY